MRATGFAMDMGSSHVVVGDRTAHGATHQDGATLVFLRVTPHPWIEQVKLFASAGAHLDLFGDAVEAEVG